MKPKKSYDMETFKKRYKIQFSISKKFSILRENVMEQKKNILFRCTIDS